MILGPRSDTHTATRALLAPLAPGASPGRRSDRTRRKPLACSRQRAPAVTREILDSGILGFVGNSGSATPWISLHGRPPTRACPSVPGVRALPPILQTRPNARANDTLWRRHSGFCPHSDFCLPHTGLLATVSSAPPTRPRAARRPGARCARSATTRAPAACRTRPWRGRARRGRRPASAAPAASRRVRVRFSTALLRLVPRAPLLPTPPTWSRSWIAAPRGANVHKRSSVSARRLWERRYHAGLCGGTVAGALTQSAHREYPEGLQRPWLLLPLAATHLSQVNRRSTAGPGDLWWDRVRCGGAPPGRLHARRARRSTAPTPHGRLLKGFPLQAAPEIMRKAPGISTRQTNVQMKQREDRVALD